MKTINCTITGQELRITPPDFRLVAGSAGLYQIALEYDSGWDVAPTRVVVFKGSCAVVPVEDETGEITIPAAVLAEPGGVSIGVIGYSADGEVRITTKEMSSYRLLRVYAAGATPEDVEATAPEEEPEFWEHLMAKVGDLADLNTEDKSSLVAAINEVLESGGGGGSGEAGGYYTPAVTQPDKSTMRVSFAPSKDGMEEVADVDVSLPKGDTGKSAYEYAQAGGYTGTEAEFAVKMANDYLPLSGGTMNGKIVFPSGNQNVGISNSSDMEVFGYGPYNNVVHLRLGDPSYPFQIRGKSERPKYNDSDFLLVGDVYEKAEIDTALGSYITDIDALVGGDS